MEKDLRPHSQEERIEEARQHYGLYSPDELYHAALRNKGKEIAEKHLLGLTWEEKEDVLDYANKYYAHLFGTKKAYEAPPDGV